MQRLVHLLRVSLFIAAFCTAQNAHAQKVLKVAYTVFPPYRMMVKGMPSGMEAELLQMIAERMKLKITFVEANFQRSLLMLKNGEVDIMSGLYKTDQREHDYLYINTSYLTDTHSFFIIKGAEQIPSYDDLQGRSIGTIEKVSYFPRFDKDSSLLKEPVQHSELNFKKLFNRRLDTVIETTAMGLHLIAQNNYQGVIVKALYQPAGQKKLYFVFSRNSTFVLRAQDFEHVLTDLIQSGEVERLRKRYFLD